MSSSWCCFFILLLSLLQTSCVSYPSPSPSPELCHPDERNALLQLKQMHYHFHPKSHYHPLKSWDNSNSDCCYWKGVICDITSGRVIGLSLPRSSLYGSIYSNSTLFHLRYLQTLKLSGNHLTGCIPSEISQLTDLVSLDLSFNRFMGQIPSELSRLTKLIFLDLSGYGFTQFEISTPRFFSQLEIPDLREFVQNLASLRELHLDGVNLSAPNNRDWCQQLSSALPNLHVLSMRNCSLIGPLVASISSLHSLSKLYLDFNRNISSTVPNSLVNLTSLTVFSLWHCNFSGPIPPSLANLTHLTILDLSENSFSGEIPSSFRGNFPNLKELWLEENFLQGSIHSYLYFLPSLRVLDLADNQFSGIIINEPTHNISSFSSPLKFYLWGNHLKGQDLMRSISKINGTFERLDLSSNDFSYIMEGTNLSYDSSHNFINAQIQKLWMIDCNLSMFPDFLRYNRELTSLDLSSNRIGGDIPKWIWQKNLSHLALFNNSLTGLELPLPNHTFNIERLDLKSNMIQESLPTASNQSDSEFVSHILDNLTSLLSKASFFSIAVNKLSGKIPFSICNASNLESLDMSHNQLSGPVPTCLGSRNLKVLSLMSNKLVGNIPFSFCNASNWEFLDLSYNQLSGIIPTGLGNSNILGFLSLESNNLVGNIPFSICNASNLHILKLSDNPLSGTIPTCLGSSNLAVLYLENSKLHGPIPPALFRSGCRLHSLKLNENMLQGKVPRSLANCEKLEVLDIGDNQLNDTFPCWLENLTQLSVLIMRSNNFVGSLGQLSHVDSPFPNLQVFDISLNAFTGNLPLQYIVHWKKMMTDADNSMLNFISFENSGYSYLDSIDIVDKGLFINNLRIASTFTTVDLSNNRFSGEIPDAMGNLKSLMLLNLSGNSLMGQIPSSLGNLSKLESLDLSRNNLSGQIPNQLTNLTFLSILNLSDNNLVGIIPQGKQFDTFSNASYEGNTGLCGFPLSRKCEITDGALPPMILQQEEDSISLLDWKFAIAGYCSGLIVGLVIGQQLFWRNNRFIAFCLRIRGSKKRKRLKRKHYIRRK